MKAHILDFEGETLVARGGLTLVVPDYTFPAPPTPNEPQPRTEPPPGIFDIVIGGGTLHLEVREKTFIRVPVHGSIYIEPPRRRTVMKRVRFDPWGRPHPRVMVPTTSPAALITLNTPPLAYGMALGENYFECFILLSTDGEPLRPDSNNFTLMYRNLCLGDVVPTLLRDGKITLPEAFWETTWESTSLIDAADVYSLAGLSGQKMVGASLTEALHIKNIHLQERTP